MTTPPDQHGPPTDETPTIVRLPLLPSPDEMEDLRRQRVAIEDTLHRQAKDAVQAVAECAAAHRGTLAALDQAVKHARAAGASWSEIARVAGISRQAATQRWGS
jgi:hypothetical protein